MVCKFTIICLTLGRKRFDKTNTNPLNCMFFYEVINNYCALRCESLYLILFIIIFLIWLWMLTPSSLKLSLWERDVNSFESYIIVERQTLIIVLAHNNNYNYYRNVLGMNVALVHLRYKGGIWKMLNSNILCTQYHFTFKHDVMKDWTAKLIVMGGWSCFLKTARVRL